MEFNDTISLFVITMIRIKAYFNISTGMLVRAAALSKY
jgi:hypothetical protein